MIKIRFTIFSLLVLLTIPLNAQQLKLHELFNEGMVLQQKTGALVWGFASPHETVSIIIQDKSFTTKASAQGQWEINLKKLNPGGPYAMHISSGNENLLIKEVYVGEVWIAGGQSNMAFTLDKSLHGTQEIASAQNSNIRFAMVPMLSFNGDKVRGNLSWQAATSAHVAPMSAVAYYFAKQLQSRLSVPVGIICCYKGGTAAEVWMSRESLISNKKYAPIVYTYENFVQLRGESQYNEQFANYNSKLKIYNDSVKAGYKNALRPEEPMGEKHYKRPYGLYNTMFKRILPYTAKGVIWYQGEANASRSEQYRTLFPALIAEWRKDFRNKHLPFYFVQLSNYDHPAYGNRPMWAELREAQLFTWKNTPKTGMAVSIDVGEKNDIHPTNKQPVGERLAAIALRQLYGFNIPYSGPVYKSVKFTDNKAILSFDFVYGGLKSDGELKGFTICGPDQKFIPAKAEINGNKIIVYSEVVNQPIAVRYGWKNWTDANLKNFEGFPATPFRTDHFELLSHGVLAPNY
jgi:sialate O-acetylesterase